MPDIKSAKIAILATNGFEQSELEQPRDALREAGAEVHVISPDGQDIRGWEGPDWCRTVEVDRKLSEVNSTDYDALVLPGGQIYTALEKGVVDGAAWPAAGSAVTAPSTTAEHGTTRQS